jgi:hypothetical protein
VLAPQQAAGPPLGADTQVVDWPAEMTLAEPDATHSAKDGRQDS